MSRQLAGWAFWASLLSFTLVSAHEGHDMDSMDSMGSSSSSSGHGDSMVMSSMMMGVFHTDLGMDTLWFDGWTPSSSGSTAGASIGLAALALFARFLLALRANLERSWRLQAHTETFEVPFGPNGIAAPVPYLQRQSSSDSTSTKQLEGQQQQIESATGPTFVRAGRLVPKFVLSRELTRAGLAMVLSFIGYLLMLAVMTTNAFFVIGIILGVGVGEFLFGRFAVLEEHH